MSLLEQWRKMAYQDVEGDAATQLWNAYFEKEKAFLLRQYHAATTRF